MKTKKLKYLLMGLLLVCMFGICGCGTAAYDFNIKSSPDFRYSNLYEDYSTVKSKEPFVKTSETSLGGYNILTYKNAELDGFNVSVVYQFNEETKEFYSGIIYYYPEESEIDSVYDSLVKKCDSLYGKNHLFVDSSSHTWKATGKYIIVYKSTDKVYYAVETPEAYE